MIGLKGSLYAPVELDNAACEFVSDTPSTAAVDDAGVVTAAASGSARITVTYQDVTDEITVVVA